MLSKKKKKQNTKINKNVKSKSQCVKRNKQNTLFFFRVFYVLIPYVKQKIKKKNKKNILFDRMIHCVCLSGDMRYRLNFNVENLF